MKTDTETNNTAQQRNAGASGTRTNPEMSNGKHRGCGAQRTGHTKPARASSPGGKLTRQQTRRCTTSPRRPRGLVPAPEPPRKPGVHQQECHSPSHWYGVTEGCAQARRRASEALLDPQRRGGGGWAPRGRLRGLRSVDCVHEWTLAAAGLQGVGLGATASRDAGPALLGTRPRARASLAGSAAVKQHQAGRRCGRCGRLLTTEAPAGLSLPSRASRPATPLRAVEDAGDTGRPVGSLHSGHRAPQPCADPTRIHRSLSPTQAAPTECGQMDGAVSGAQARQVCTSETPCGSTRTRPYTRGGGQLSGCRGAARRTHLSDALEGPPGWGRLGVSTRPPNCKRRPNPNEVLAGGSRMTSVGCAGSR